MKQERDWYVLGGAVLIIIAVLAFNGGNLSGQTSRNLEITRDLDENEYSFYVGDTLFIEGKRVTLITIGGSEEVIVDVAGIQKSVDKAGGRVISGLQIENIAVGLDNAILRVTSLEDKKSFCEDSDEGDIYVGGICKDRFYPDGVSDYCDFSYLSEYSCGYDKDVDEIHCLRHVVECSDGCGSGSCLVR